MQGYGCIAAGALGLSLLAPSIESQDLIHTLSGSTGDDFGIAVSDAGDVNTDGFADVIVGGIQDGVPSAGAGFARVFSGRDGAVLFNFAGDDPGDTFGNSVGAVGDVNADGVGDLVVGAVWDDVTGAFGGSLRVHSGASGAVLLSVPADAGGDFYGIRVSGAGDVDLDGVPDVLVGAVEWLFAGEGYARVLSGTDGSTIHHWDGAHSNSQFGYSVSDLGDVNADGVPDVVVGAWWENLTSGGSGSARIFSGSDGSVLATYSGAPGAHMGSSVATAGDVDGDGTPDVILGASGDATAGAYAGGAFVRSGASGALLHSFHGFAPGDQLGNCVHGAGDVNGDGRDDLVVGAIHAEPAGQYSGSAYVFSGLDGAVLHQIDGAGASDFLGASVSGAGDVNGDGAADVIVGAKLSDVGAVDGGAAFVISGRPFFEPFGQGCAGLVATASGEPALGVGFALELSGALPGLPAWPFLGISDTSWQGLPLPLDLALFGAPGCKLLTGMTVSLPTQVTDGAGEAAVSLILPSTPGLAGLVIHAQWGSIDPLALATSNGLHVTIQP